MTDICTNDDHDSDDENCDQQEIESYLYSLVHHGTLEEENQPGPGGEMSPEGGGDDDSTTAAQKTWRYFNVTSGKDAQNNFKHIQQRSKQYIRTDSSQLQRNFVWRRPMHSVMQSNKVAAMGALKSKGKKSFPNVISKGASSANCPGASEVTFIDGETENNQEKRCTLPKNENIHQDLTIGSSSTEDSNSQVNISLSLTEHNIEITDDDSVQVPNQDNEIKDDLNDTNADSSRPRSCLDESLTQAMQLMLQEDASRSSIESSDRRPAQKSKAAISSVAKPGWTVGMSWEDMSSKGRFNFEVDSVCGDSMMEGSSTPDAAVSTSPQDVSSYDVSLKRKTDTAEEIISDSSDCESVVEVVKPPKDPPPILQISSDDEDLPPSKKKKVDESEEPQEMEEDIVILYEDVTPVENTNSRTCIIPAVEVNPVAVNPVAVNPVAVNPVAHKPKLSAARRKRRERRWKRLAQRRTDNDDELGNILKNMSDNPNLWRLCNEDIYPRQSPLHPPCENCKQRDHSRSHCPEPLKVKVCLMCARSRHDYQCCPERMCLNCGRPTHAFIKACRPCVRRPICKICLFRGHESNQCPDLWRRFHFTIKVLPLCQQTTRGPPIPPPSDIEVPSSAEMWCCNCATKGHLSDTCPKDTSPINEKRFSHVVSYVDPTVDSRISNHQSAAAKDVSSSSTTCPKTNASNLKPEGQNSAGNSPCVLENFTSTVEFKNNYKLMRTKFNGIEGFPSQPTALANYLEEHLERIKAPVLSDREVRFYFKMLSDLLKRQELTKRTLRKAGLFASKLNMTVIGFGGHGKGRDLVRTLRNKIKVIRRMDNTKKVSENIRQLINEPFSQLFKPVIVNNMNVLVSNYLRRRNYDFS